MDNNYKPKEKKPGSDAKKQKNIKPVAKGHVKKQNKWLKKFITEDYETIKDYAISDVLIPSIKEGIRSVIDMVLGEDTRNRRNTYGKESYRKYYENKEKRTRRDRRYDREYEYITVATREEAEKVLDGLIDLIDEYGRVTLGDFYYLTGVDGNSYTCEDWGWTSLRYADYTRTGNGEWRFILPEPKPLPR